MVLLLFGQLSVVVSNVHLFLRLRLRVRLAIYLGQELTNDVLPGLVQRAGLCGSPLPCKAFLGAHIASKDILEASTSLFRLD